MSRKPKKLSKRELIQEFRSIATMDDDGNQVPRFVDPTWIAETLQGYSCKVLDTTTDTYACVKACLIDLHKKKVSFEGVKIEEDILKESALLKTISESADCPKCIAKWIYQWQDHKYYYVATEYCSGGSLFDFMLLIHKDNRFVPTMDERLFMGSLREQNLFLPPTHEYKRLKICRSLFAQLCQCVQWLHEEATICHLDLSLENLMVATSDLERPLLKVIDWGLAIDCTARQKQRATRRFFRVMSGARHFHRNVWSYDKNVGKRGYKAYEVRLCGHKKGHVYDPEAADVWTLGVILFMLVFRTYPFKTCADYRDPLFVAMMRGELFDYFASKKWLCWITQDLFDVFDAIFQQEENRVTMSELLELPFVKDAFSSRHSIGSIMPGFTIFNKKKPRVVAGGDEVKMDIDSSIREDEHHMSLDDSSLIFEATMHHGHYETATSDVDMKEDHQKSKTPERETSMPEAKSRSH